MRMSPSTCVGVSSPGSRNAWLSSSAAVRGTDDAIVVRQESREPDPLLEVVVADLCEREQSGRSAATETSAALAPGFAREQDLRTNRSGHRTVNDPARLAIGDEQV
jgi:hypothetical protein